MPKITLCCPYAERHTARAAGASSFPQSRAWAIPTAAVQNPDTLARTAHLLPRKFNPDIPGPWLTPNLVPQPLWGKNLRSLLPTSDWDRIRRSTYDACGKRCTICGNVGSRWPVEADEVWHYDDATLTQTLVAVTGLCPACHEVRHWGKAINDGHGTRALNHLASINNWSLVKSTEQTNLAMTLWHQRSRQRWKSDYSHAIKTYSVTISETGISRAAEANRRIVAEASKRYRQTRQP